MEHEFPHDDPIYADSFLRLNDAIIANQYLFALVTSRQKEYQEYLISLLIPS